jgi:hypothetical protein
VKRAIKAWTLLLVLNACEDDFAVDEAPPATTQSCILDRDCPSGQACIKSVCRAPEGGSGGAAGTAGAAPGGSAGACPALTATDTPCDRCIASECCAEASACIGETACGACSGGDATSCAGSTTYTPFATCVQQKCVSACGDGDVCPGVSYTNPTTCTTCAEQSCCNALTACLNNGNCKACIGGDSAACGASGLDEAALGCLQASCQQACQ